MPCATSAVMACLTLSWMVEPNFVARQLPAIVMPKVLVYHTATPDITVTDAGPSNPAFPFDARNSAENAIQRNEIAS
ncbi:hypothetical protein MTO96_041247 [Rhipicephalus appendiculatus]